MGWRGAGRVAPIVVALVAAAAGADEPDGVCELARADRARTSSRSCVACHDGSTGMQVAVGPAGAGHGDHPVDVDYAAAAARDPGGYVPAAMLPPHVPLVAGKVACTSCHDGASSHPKRAVDPAGLCMACHRK